MITKGLALAFLALPLVFAAVADDTYEARRKRIINGYRVKKDNEIPYQARVIYDGDEFSFCGGVIISERHILTAAHCVDMVKSLEYLTVKIGSTNRSSSNSYSAQKIKRHENYLSRATQLLLNDIAIITLNENIQITESQRPISLPKKNTPADVTGIVSGFGLYANNMTELEIAKEILRGLEKLNAALVPIISNDQCNEIYRSDPKDPNVITDTHMCSLTVHGVIPCTGDSGGPLVYNNEVVGIVSCSQDCGLGLPQVYTRVYKYLDWIYRAMK